MRLRRSGWLVLPVSLALYVLAAGCDALTDTSTDTSTTTLVGQPIVELDPAEFLDATPDVLCAKVPGAMQSYVVTFFDLGPKTDDGLPAAGYPVTLSSSDPTPCSQRVAFTNGVPAHRYVAAVDGYEEDASTLQGVCSQKPAYAQCISVGKAPLGGGLCETDADCFANGCYGRCRALPKQELMGATCQTVIVDSKTVPVNVCDYTAVQGDRHMVKKGSFAPVTPRWTSPENEPCGWVDPPTPAQYERAEIRPCAPLTDSKETSPSVTGIRVIPDECAQPDVYPSASIASFTVAPADSGKAGGACKPGKDAVYTQGVEPGKAYVFTVEAQKTGDTMPTLTAKCFATAVKGVTVQAKCDPLVANP
ncbi:MAG: hypothetical protein QM820_47315 [Minicystis sp.]